ncbi:MAG: ABC transporter ATP-binding protein [Sediminibacterium sp.]
MSKPILHIDRISKKYQLGVMGSGALKKDLQAWFNKQVLQKKEAPDPEAYDEANRDYIWALRNLDFKIHEGDSFGIVGNNGSGKSTLLKIISRISLPTSGTIHGRGRIASLLEVGTGFHPELTGRENVLLNGQILGMQKKEVLAKFDEIVDFSGIERFIDTPVKRYSSGMYVRLAFSVAAHLQTDILIIDEVLAVGDVDFQRKCLKKMKSLSTEKGKTVIFVSHHMQALRNLCNKAIWLEKGRLVEEGAADTVINKYLSREKVETLSQYYPNPASAPGNEWIRINQVALNPKFNTQISYIDTRTPLDFEFSFWFMGQNTENIQVLIDFYQLTGECIFELCSEVLEVEKGLVDGKCRIPGTFLNNGYYYVSMSFLNREQETIYEFAASVAFDVIDYRNAKRPLGKWDGAVRPDFPVELSQVSFNTP